MLAKLAESDSIGVWVKNKIMEREYVKTWLASFCLLFAVCANAQYGPGGMYRTPIPVNQPPEEPKITILVTNVDVYGRQQVVPMRVNSRDYVNAQAYQQYMQ